MKCLQVGLLEPRGGSSLLPDCRPRWMRRITGRTLIVVLLMTELIAIGWGRTGEAEQPCILC